MAVSFFYHPLGRDYRQALNITTLPMSQCKA